MGKKPRFGSDILHGSLEMLILRTLAREPAHGYAIARRLEHASGDVLAVGESSLYPACSACSSMAG
jgi:DNA-binding PadR family transcriptional regulator